MKDLEKIKSEDLAAQVQDANPANFAIEQEVAAMVGATVPAPTEPSADDARELPAQLLVFLRRALTPIQTALRTAVAAIYAHLDSRCTDYTPAAYAPYSAARRAYDPMGTLPARSVANLLTALTAFSDRKISGVPEAADGISLVHIIHSAYAITELTDDNTGWVLTKSITNTAYPSLEKLHLGCKDAMFGVSSYAISGLTLDEFSMDEVEQFSGISLTANQDTVRIPKLKKAGSLGNADIIHVDGCKVLDLPEFDVFSYVGNATAISGDSLEQILMQKFRGVPSSAGWLGVIRGCANLWKVVWGKIAYSYTWGYNDKPNFNNCPNLIHLEFGQDIAISINIPMWNPTNALSSSASDLVADPTAHPTWKNLDQFLHNFRDHIALRLTANGSGKTLTLSQAVRDAIHAAEATYGIEAIIVTQKGWTLSPAPTA